MTFNASAEWINLGLALDIDYDHLKTISKDNREKCNDCLREMLDSHLNSNPHLTWDNICSALRHHTVGRSDLAEKIERNYVANAG